MLIVCTTLCKGRTVVDPGARNGRIVRSVKNATTNSSGERSDGQYTGLRVHSADVPEKGPGVTIFINGEKRCPGTEVLDRVIQNWRKA